MSSNQLIYVDSPHVVYGDEQISVNYSYETTKIKTVDNRVVVSEPRKKHSLFDNMCLLVIFVEQSKCNDHLKMSRKQRKT